MDGLLKHLQGKWRQVADQLDGSLQLYLTGSVTQQEASRVFWGAQGVAASLTVCHRQYVLINGKFNGPCCMLGCTLLLQTVFSS